MSKFSLLCRGNLRRVKCFLTAFLMLSLTACDQSIPASVILTEGSGQNEGEITTAEETEIGTDGGLEEGNLPNGDLGTRVVLVGDSRVYNLATLVCGLEENDDGCIIGSMGSDYVICSGGVGYKWMVEHEKDIDEQAVNGAAIVINMGINGCEPLSGETLDQFAERYSSLYADWINKKAEYWESRGAKIYFCSISPVNDEKAKEYNYNVRNEYVRCFNEAIVPKLNDNVGYIDTYSAVYDILAAGKGTDDGLHYYKYVYEEIKGFIWQTVNEKQ